MAGHKLAKISSEISRHISNIILTESRDKILKSITITGCNVTNDYSYANLYFTSLLDMPHETLEKEVNEASKFLRGRLSQEIDLRHTPILRFHYDKSVEYGNNIEKIIDNINNK